MQNDAIWEDLPQGLSFFVIGDSDSPWTQGAALKKQPSDYLMRSQLQSQLDDAEDDTMKKQQTACLDKPRRNVYVPNMLQQVIVHIDETLALYSRKSSQNIELALKESLQECVTKGPIAKLLGPKRCREILTYMSTPMHTTHGSFFELWSFLLQRPIQDSQGTQFCWNVQSTEGITAITLVTKK